MSLPFYHTHTLKTAHLEEVNTLLQAPLNSKHPTVINLKNLEFDQQREVIGLVENHFVTNNISFKFPYPLYIITDHLPTISGIRLVRSTEELPKFFTHRDGKMNVKESHLVGRNSLIQQEILNGDATSDDQKLKDYGRSHRRVYELETERLYYKNLVTQLTKAKNG